MAARQSLTSDTVVDEIVQQQLALAVLVIDTYALCSVQWIAAQQQVSPVSLTFSESISEESGLARSSNTPWPFLLRTTRALLPADNADCISL